MKNGKMYDLQSEPSTDYCPKNSRRRFANNPRPTFTLDFSSSSGSLSIFFGGGGDRAAPWRRLPTASLYSRVDDLSLGGDGGAVAYCSAAK